MGLSPLAHPKQTLRLIAQKRAKYHNSSIIGEGRKAGRNISCCHLKKLHNLEALPGEGFAIFCFPHTIRDTSASWPRAVAIFEG